MATSVSALEYWTASRRLLRSKTPNITKRWDEHTALNNLAVLHHGTALGKAAESSLRAAYDRAKFMVPKVVAR